MSLISLRKKISRGIVLSHIEEIDNVKFLEKETQNQSLSGNQNIDTQEEFHQKVPETRALDTTSPCLTTLVVNGKHMKVNFIEILSKGTSKVEFEAQLSKNFLVMSPLVHKYFFPSKLRILQKRNSHCIFIMSEYLAFQNPIQQKKPKSLTSQILHSLVCDEGRALKSPEAYEVLEIINTVFVNIAYICKLMY